MRGTALDQFQRLEATGLYTPPGGGQRVDVWLSIGAATLTVTDRADRVVTHWSLAAIERVNPGKAPARFTLDGTPDEELEIADETFAAALDRVHRAVEAARPRPGLLRGRILAAVVILSIGLLAWWLPDALTRTAARSMPEAARQALDARLLTHVTRLTGPACDAAQGREALATLLSRLEGGGPARAEVLPEAFSGVRELPGGLAVAGAGAIAAATSPAEVAGAFESAHGQAMAEDPLVALLDRAGLRATVTLLVSGQIDDTVLAEEARHIVRDGGLQADGHAGAATLGDDRWVALRAICDR